METDKAIRVFLVDDHAMVREGLAALIAKDPELNDVPVVMASSVTASDYAGHFPTDQPLHVHMFLDKPIPLRKLLDVANSLVQQKESPS